jgi:hypothetical protein
MQIRRGAEGDEMPDLLYDFCALGTLFFVWLSNKMEMKLLATIDVFSEMCTGHGSMFS